MKNKTIVLCFIAVLFGLSMLVAQKPCNNFDCKIALARQALKANPPQYKNALDLARGAESYDPKRKAEVYDFIDVVFNAIEQKRIEAETQKKLAEQATKKAKDAETKAKAEQTKAEKALADVKTAYNTNARQKLDLARKYEKEGRYPEASETAQFAMNIAQDKPLKDSIAACLWDLSKTHVYHIQYDEAFQNLELLKNNSFVTDSFRLLVLELAYFYTEADTTAAAVKTLKLLNINSLPNRMDLLKTIEQNCPPQYFTFLNERYYPKMMPVEGGVHWRYIYDKEDKLTDSINVKVSNFNIAKTETTVWQYFLYLKAKKLDDTEQYSGDKPMVDVSWYDAVEYANWVSQRRGKTEVYDIDKTQKDTNNLNKNDDVKWIVKTKQTNGYRLPTEAEWEFAARGGKKTQGFEYSGDSVLTNVAWFSDNSNSRIHSVATLKANELGLYDMSGNVWEWCSDWYGSYNNGTVSGAVSTTVNNPTGAVKGTNRVTRGGGWVDYAQFCRVAGRSYYAPAGSSYRVSFRLVFIP